MQRFLLLSILPISLLFLPSCFEDGLESTPTAEMYYVDLLYALQQRDQAAATEAAQQFSSSIAGFYVGNYPMRSDQDNEGMRFHLKQAEEAYVQVRAAIEKQDLDAALQHLHHASSELEAARIPGFEDFYVAGMGGFLRAWMELSQSAEADTLSPKEWRVLKRNIKATYSSWRQSQWVVPSPAKYYFSQEDAEAFKRDHDRVGQFMERLKASLAEDDVELTKSYVAGAKAAVWTLLRRFGSPEQRGPEEDSTAL